MRFREITEAAIALAIAKASEVSGLEAEVRISAQVLDRLITQALSEGMGCVLGRAMAPAFNILVSNYGSEEGRVEAHFAAERRIVRFLSEPTPLKDCDALVAELEQNPPTHKLDVEDDLQLTRRRRTRPTRSWMCSATAGTRR